MTKQIKVNDDVYTKLKAEADKNYRTIGNQIDYLLNQKIEPVIEKVDTMFETLNKNNPTFTEPKINPERTYKDVLTEITAKEKERDEAIAYCQDNDTKHQIKQRYVQEISDLWAEYKDIKERES